MKQVLQTLKGEVRVEEVPPPVLRRSGVLVHNVCSLVSAGTERANIEQSRQSLLVRAHSRPDLVAQVARKVLEDGPRQALEAVIDRLNSFVPLGYSAAGIVTEATEDSGFRVGDRVACAGGGYACHAEVVWVPKNLCVPLPVRRPSADRAGDDLAEKISFEEGAFVAVGAIAMQGVRQADVRLGEAVAVVGLGLIGLLTVQILKAAGCEVLGVDLDPERVDFALALGADAAVVGGQCPEGHVEEGVLQAAGRLASGRGIDAVVLTAATTSRDPIVLAGAIARDRGRVVAVGDIPLDVPRQTYYEKELDLRLSRSYGPGRYDPSYEIKGVDYPIGYVPWTEQHNMAAFLALVAQGRLAVSPLITHRFPIARAEAAYSLLTGRSDRYIGILLTYSGQPSETRRDRVEVRPRRAAASTRPGRVALGMVGAGSFGRATLLPILKRLPGLVLQGVATQSGFNAKDVARRHGFHYCTGDYREIFADAETDAVVIATRHDLHAQLVAEALEAGKHVFVEKPLCLTVSELEALRPVVARAQKRERVLMVGFNRRFAPYTEQARALFTGRGTPLVVTYRVNAGRIPRDHWTLDPEIGGGRLIGELCHFVDFCSFVIGDHPTAVGARAVAGDTLVADLVYADRSVAQILYLDNGHVRIPKERVEIFGDESVCVIDDFRRIHWASPRGHGHAGRWIGRDKGHRRQLEVFVRAVASGAPDLVDTAGALRSMEATLAIANSLTRGRIPSPGEARV